MYKKERNRPFETREEVLAYHKREKIPCLECGKLLIFYRAISGLCMEYALTNIVKNGTYRSTSHWQGFHIWRNKVNI